MDELNETTSEVLTAEALDDADQEIDRLIRKKHFWGTLAVIFFIIWLLIIMYILYPGQVHQDTIKPPNEPETITEEGTNPETDTVDEKPDIEPERVHITEYVIKADKISPIFEGAITKETETHGRGMNEEEILAYTDNCSLSYIVEEGDNSFIATREDSSSPFIGVNYSFDNLTGSSQTIVDGGSIDTEADRKRIIEHSEECGKKDHIVVEKDRYTKPNEIVGVAVILKDIEGVPEGLSTLKEKLNALNDNGTLETMYTVGGMSLPEFASFVGECFGTKGYTISNIEEINAPDAPDIDFEAEGMTKEEGVGFKDLQAPENDIMFLKTEDGGIQVEGDMLENEDTIVFFSVENLLLTPYTTAIYSQIQEGTYDGVVYDK